jgi:outer membrane immunogenic protein
MKKCLLALLLSSALVPAAAMAADMPVKAPPMAPLPPAISWTGFYIGGNVGGAWSNTDATDQNGRNFFSDTVAGVVGGGQIGYNWQINNWLIGVEGDFNGSSQRESGAIIDPLTGAAVADAEAKVQWFATARGRLGYVNGPWLIYATGGAAWVNFEASVNVPGIGSVSDETTRSGWTVGGGVEWMFLPKWSAKLEYLFIDVGDRTFDDGNGNNMNVKLQENVVRVGLNYHF